MSILSKVDRKSYDEIQKACRIYDEITNGILRREYYFLQEDGEKFVVMSQVIPVAEKLSEVEAEITAREQELVMKQTELEDLKTVKEALTKVEVATPVEVIETPVEEINP